MFSPIEYLIEKKEYLIENAISLYVITNIKGCVYLLYISCNTFLCHLQKTYFRDALINYYFT